MVAVNYELEAEQSKYMSEKYKYGNSLTQLEICKKKEKELKNYCAQRLKEIEEMSNRQATQQLLFT